MTPSRLPPQLQSFLASRFVLAAALFLIIVVSFGLSRELIRRVETQSEIRRLEAEARRLEGQRQELEGLLTFLSTSTFQEAEARVKLNLRKPRETVIILPSAIASAPSGPSDATARPRSNPERWWEYFVQ